MWPFWMVILGFWLCDFRGSQHNWFSAESPSLVLLATGSTGLNLISSFDMRRGNPVQGRPLVHVGGYFILGLVLFLWFVGARLLFWSTILGFVFPLVSLFLMISVLLGLFRTWRVILRTMRLLLHQDLFHCSTNSSNTLHIVHVISTISLVSG
jgi:hypothetical protein